MLLFFTDSISVLLISEKHDAEAEAEAEAKLEEKKHEKKEVYDEAKEGDQGKEDTEKTSDKKPKDSD